MHVAEELKELREKEKEQGVEPDPEIDAFMKANTIQGKRESIETEYVMHVLGLKICSETKVGPAHQKIYTWGSRLLYIESQIWDALQVQKVNK